MAVCKEIGNEGVTDSVNLYLDVLKSQSAVFNTMANCKKPDNVKFMVNIATDKKKDMIALERKNRKYMNHIRCIEDSLNMFAWFQIPTEEKDAFMAQLADFFGAIDFVGTKLQGEDLDKKWYRAFRDVQKDFYEFIKANFPAVTVWSGSNTDAQGQYTGLLDGKITVSAAPAKKVEEKKPEPVKKAAPAKAAVVPKTPVKQLKFMTWEVSNYVNGEEITFDEDDIGPAMTINCFNCEKIKVTVPGKIKNFMLMKCKKMEINLDSCVSMGEVIKCESVKLYVEKTVPSISVELSNGIQVFCTLESKNKTSISTTASQSVSMVAPKDPGTFDPKNEEHDPNKTEVVPETFCSKYVDGKFVTAPEEGGFD